MPSVPTDWLITFTFCKFYLTCSISVCYLSNKEFSSILFVIRFRLYGATAWFTIRPVHGLYWPLRSSVVVPYIYTKQPVVFIEGYRRLLKAAKGCWKLRNARWGDKLTNTVTSLDRWLTVQNIHKNTTSHASGATALQNAKSETFCDWCHKCRLQLFEHDYLGLAQFLEPEAKPRFLTRTKENQSPIFCGPRNSFRTVRLLYGEVKHNVRPCLLPAKWPVIIWVGCWALLTHSLTVYCSRLMSCLLPFNEWCLRSCFLKLCEIVCFTILASWIWQFVSGHEWNYSRVFAPRRW